MKKDFVCQGDFDHKIWGAVSVMMEDVGLVNLSVEAIRFWAVSPATRGSFGRFQADLFFTPQISFADSSNSQSVMPGCILPRNIQGFSKGEGQQPKRQVSR